MHRSRFGAACAAFVASSSVLATGPARGQDELYKPEVAAASPDASQSIRSIRPPAGFKVELFASEPMVANPVAFCVDERGRFFVAETFRLHDGVTDNRSHMDWLDADMASRTVADRVAMYRKFLKPDEFAHYQVEHDRVRLVEDRDGDGKADHASVFADGFKNAADGIGAGLLARKGDVFYTCIPDLWRLRDKDGDGKAEVKEALSTGYGVHVAFLGHDLHGLKMGPDGRLYFSVGDRGLNVTTREGKHLFAPDFGSVLRCEPDGSKLEIFATGLRNPQELAFDDFGNLFTCDNNSDGGDQARWVHVVEGGDSGWRMGYQYLDFPTSRGPWNAEKLWHPRWDGQAAYIVPPIINIANGPSGLVHDPGTGFPAAYRGHFFLADFRGGAGNSGIRSFANKPKGASFELVDAQEFVWSVLATDVDFGPDGSMYVLDWTNGWDKTGKGRIWKVTAKETDPKAAEVKKLIAEGMTKRPDDELAKLLGHRDQRVRMESQFELVDRALKLDRDWWERTPLTKVASEENPQLARLHAIWGLGQIARVKDLARRSLGPLPIERYFNDKDPEVRAQVAKVLGDIGWPPWTPASNHYGVKIHELKSNLINEGNPRVRFFLAKLARGLGEEEGSQSLFDMLRKNNDEDAYLRHATVMGLVRDNIGPSGVETILKGAADPSPAVRLGVLLALRRLGRPEVAKFLDDADPRVATEAGLAIYEVPIPDAMPALAAIAPRKGLTERLLRRAINAANRVGRPEDASALAAVAGRSEVSKDGRVESLSILAAWANPPGRDRINGLWRPIDARPAKVAADALRPAVKGLLEDAPDEVRREAIRAVAELGIREAGPDLLALVVRGKGSGAARADAIKVLEKLGDPRLAEAVEAAAGSDDGAVRSEGLRILIRLNPGRAIPALAKVLDSGSIPERQRALEILGPTDRPEADPIVARWLDRLIEHKAPAAIEMELIDAASKRKSAEVRDRLAQFERERPKDGPIADHHAELEGGDVERGRKIYSDNAAVYCVRCHKVKGEGGEVGPDLTGIGTRHPRAYLLESIVVPNQAIAQGFESVLIARNDGQVVTGVFKSEDDKVVRIMTAEAKLVEVPKADIDERKRGGSAMPEDLVKKLTRAEIRDLVEFLASLK